MREPDESLLHEIVRRYAEPHRSYHTMQHLDECFANFDSLRDAADHPGEIELALWEARARSNLRCSITKLSGA